VHDFFEIVARIVAHCATLDPQRYVKAAENSSVLLLSSVATFLTGVHRGSRMGLAEFFVWLADFFDKGFFMLFVATGLFFLLMFITWWLYYTLSRRNIFQLKTRSGDADDATGWEHAVYVMKYFFMFPIFSFITFLFFTFGLFILIKPDAALQPTVIYIGIIVVSTIRMSAYVHEAMAEDLAKLIPLSFLTIFVTHPTPDAIGITWQQFVDFAALIPGFFKYLIFTIVLEAFLRGGSWLAHGMKKNRYEEDPDD
jgi:hypothetical protein